jgi:hypothetical protein
MHTNRIPFAHPPRKSRVDPVYVALVLLVSASLAGFAVALWPEDPLPAAPRQSDGAPEPAGGSFESGLRVLPPGRGAPARRTWM